MAHVRKHMVGEWLRHQRSRLVALFPFITSSFLFHWLLTDICFGCCFPLPFFGQISILFPRETCLTPTQYAFQWSEKGLFQVPFLLFADWVTWSFVETSEDHLYLAAWLASEKASVVFFKGYFRVAIQWLDIEYHWPLSCTVCVCVSAFFSSYEGHAVHLWDVREVVQAQHVT